LNHTEEGAKGLEFHKLIGILNRRRWLIGGIFLFSVILTLVISLLLAKEYTARTVLLPPELERGEISLSGRLGLLGGYLGGILPKGGVSPVITAIIKSRRTRTAVVKRFSLMERFKYKNLEEALLALEDRMEVSVSPVDNTITLEVTTEDPKLSADIANFCIEYLDTVNEELQITTQKPMVKVLDPAYPPIEPSSPKIKLNLLVAGLLSLFMGILISLLLDIK